MISPQLNKHMKYFFICLFLFLFPTLTHAAVTINEIAWMGNEESANNEWIELYNSGSESVDVTGWVLTDGMKFEVELAGAVGAGQYAVLERTDESSAAGTAFLIYSGVLVNTGATLSLYRADGSLEDRVVGGENWQNVGGDNTTKETAQYTPQGWVTAVATPGASYQGSTGSSESQSGSYNQNESSDNIASSHSVSTPTLHFVPRTLSIDMIIPDRVYVNQEVTMMVVPTGLAQGILNSLEHRWNFGDVTTAQGKEVKKRFTYAGEYVVTLRSSYKEYEAFARKTITVLPVVFSITLSPQGDVQVHNDARYEVDISGYKIAGGTTITFPEGTILLPKATITIPKKRLKFTNNATLFDASSVQVATLIASVAPTHNNTISSVPNLPQEQSLPNPIVSQNTSVPQKEDVKNASFGFLSQATLADASPAGKIGTGIATSVLPAQQLANGISAPTAKSTQKLPYFALLAVIGVGVFAVVAGTISKTKL